MSEKRALQCSPFPVLPDWESGAAAAILPLQGTPENGAEAEPK